MAFLFGGTSIAEVVVGGNNITSTSNSSLVSATVTEGILANNHNEDSITFSLNNRVKQFGVGFHSYVNGSVEDSSNVVLVELFDTVTSPNSALRVVYNGANLSVDYSAASNGTWTNLVTEAHTPFSVDRRDRLDFDFKIGAVDGYFKFYLDGELVMNFTGNINVFSSNVNINKVTLRPYNEIASGNFNVISGIVADTTRVYDRRLLQLEITDAGLHEFTGAIGNVIQDEGFNDDTSIVSSDFDQLQTYKASYANNMSHWDTEISDHIVSVRAYKDPVFPLSQIGLNLAYTDAINTEFLVDTNIEMTVNVTSYQLSTNVYPITNTEFTTNTFVDFYSGIATYNPDPFL